jgi:hypothetical protein
MELTTMRLKYKEIETFSNLLMPRKGGPGPKQLEIGKTIYESPYEKMADNSVHKFYKVPIQAVNANPAIVMHCEVRTAGGRLDPPVLVGMNRWVNTEYFIWFMAAALADSGRHAGWSRRFERYRVEWLRLREKVEEVADLAERFVLEIPKPPFAIAEVRVKADSLMYTLRAGAGGEMIDSRFWDLWNYILLQDADEVGTFEVVLRGVSFS